MSNGKIKIETPLTDDLVKTLKVGTEVLINGTIFTGRDSAHKRMTETLAKGEQLPFDPKGQVIYFAGPTPPKPGKVIGSAGPTTSYRMNKYAPDMIDAGLDTTNPIQTSCAGMEPAGLKRDFGDRLCLWGGGCDTQTVLPKASPEEVRQHVLERLEILAPGGGFVFQQVHNTLAGVPPENVVAMFEAVKEFNGR